MSENARILQTLFQTHRDSNNKQICRCRGSFIELTVQMLKVRTVSRVQEQKCSFLHEN